MMTAMMQRFSGQHAFNQATTMTVGGGYSWLNIEHQDRQSAYNALLMLYVEPAITAAQSHCSGLIQCILSRNLCVIAVIIGIMPPVVVIIVALETRLNTGEKAWLRCTLPFVLVTS